VAQRVEVPGSEKEKTWDSVYCVAGKKRSTTTRMRFTSTPVPGRISSIPILKINKLGGRGAHMNSDFWEKNKVNAIREPRLSKPRACDSCSSVFILKRPRPGELPWTGRGAETKRVLLAWSKK